ncbi:hypothetical protein GCM10020229_44160 [Kitasatospora albolonga]
MPPGVHLVGLGEDPLPVVDGGGDGRGRGVEGKQQHAPKITASSAGTRPSALQGRGAPPGGRSPELVTPGARGSADVRLRRVSASRKTPTRLPGADSHVHVSARTRQAARSLRFAQFLAPLKPDGWAPACR